VSVGGGVAHKSQAPNANKKNLDSRPNVLRLSNVNGDDARDKHKGDRSMDDRVLQAKTNLIIYSHQCASIEFSLSDAKELVENCGVTPYMVKLELVTLLESISTAGRKLAEIRLKDKDDWFIEILSENVDLILENFERKVQALPDSEFAV
jgi:hypothetical protein